MVRSLQIKIFLKSQPSYILVILFAQIYVLWIYIEMLRQSDLLDKNEISVTPVFVSIDPERDTPEVIGDFVKYHHPKMIGLTGSKRSNRPRFKII